MKSTEEVFTRQELYDLVWQEPMTKLAPKFGLSDVGLSKVCRKHKIPKPPVGYWAKIEFGKKVKRPKLRKIKSEELIFLNRFHGKIIQQAQKLKPKPPPIVRVLDHLIDPHPFIELTNKCLSSDRSTRQNQESEKCLKVYVSSELLPRALRIFDAIIKHWVLIGGTIELKETRFEMNGESVSVVVSEKRRRIESPKIKSEYWGDYEYEDTGRLKLELVDRGSARRGAWGDTDTKTMEENTGSFIVGLEKCLDQKRTDRINAGYRQRQQAKVDLVRYENSQRIIADENRGIDLMKQLASWEESVRIRNFISYIESQPLEARNPQFSQDWLAWAHWYADTLCPLTETQERVHLQLPSTNVLIEELDLRPGTRQVLLSMPIKDTDDLNQCSRTLIEQCCTNNHRDVWSEVDRVLEGLGYDVSLRDRW